MEEIINKMYEVDYPDRCHQACPFCGEKQLIIMRGLVADIETREIHIAHDKGYSYCNCRNIFYTDWKNIDPTIYDEHYFKKYDSPNLKKIGTINTELTLKILQNLKPDIKTFIEIGSPVDITLDHVSSKGIDVTGTDITMRESKHKFYSMDFEASDKTDKYDCIWAAHVVEHFKDPGKAILKFKEMMANDGMLYISMPDTYFIDFDNTIDFDWVVQEHHIMWNMHDFIEYMEELGFECIYKRRGIDLYRETNDRWFWLQEFKTVFKKK